ncbi:hypothetical protein CDG81_21590 [Actinopolyspora erythraea]|uniref:Lipoprotein n=1 Tax=Actinopolyspora erythraea TaxID=414996 RepID=A0A223RX33_9ACTN|nr:hypothetical protein [Actinopolyspora erythraea]ASU80432.1 hypothetical protein CDG81_21590 [Actinopolyspora erythraea]
MIHPRRGFAPLACSLSLPVLLGCLVGDRPVGTSSSWETGPVRSVTAYFRTNNAAARLGPEEQRVFLHRTQHPDYRSPSCSLGGMTVTAEPAPATLRPDGEFTVAGSRPRGSVWVIGVEVTVRRDGAIVGRQLGSQHLVRLGGQWYGFAPCPR